MRALHRRLQQTTPQRRRCGRGSGTSPGRGDAAGSRYRRPSAAHPSALAFATCSSRSSARPWPSMPERISPASRSPRRIDGAGRRRRAGEGDRQQPLAHQPAILHARGQLLADEAALGEVDPVQLFEPALQQRRLLDHQVAAAVGHAEREPQPLIRLRARPPAKPSCASVAPRVSLGSRARAPSRAQTRVDEHEALLERRARRPAAPADRAARATSSPIRAATAKRALTSSRSTLERRRYISSRRSSSLEARQPRSPAAAAPHPGR